MVGQWKGFGWRKWYVLRSSASPIVRAWNGKLCPIFDIGRNQHGLIARENRLTERNVTLGIVLAPYITGPVDAVRFIRERLLNGSAFVAIKSSVLCSVSIALPIFGRSENQPLTVGRSTMSHLDPIVP